jgi:hypothetical protein
MTLWNAILAWFYRDFPCGCRIARHWDGATVCSTHLAKIKAGERVVLNSRTIVTGGVDVKIRNVRRPM